MVIIQGLSRYVCLQSILTDFGSLIDRQLTELEREN